MLQMSRDAAKLLSCPNKKLASEEGGHWLFGSLIKADNFFF